MDVRERINADAALAETIETMIDRRLSNVHVAMPVKVVKDSDGHTVHLQPLVKRVQRMPDGTEKAVSYPVIQDAPVQFPSGGGVTMTHPIKKDDEGLMIIGSRGIDAWHQQGGEQNPIDARVHDLSDGFYIPGVRSTPRKLNPAPSTTSTQMRSDDGHHVIDLHPTDGIKISSNQPMVHQGDLHVTGDVIADSNGTKISLLKHIHGGVEPGGGNTLKPNGNE